MREGSASVFPQQTHSVPEEVLQRLQGLKLNNKISSIKVLIKKLALYIFVADSYEHLEITQILTIIGLRSSSKAYRD